MPSATARPPFAYATKTGRAAWLELTKFASQPAGKDDEPRRPVPVK
jgi:hypothetical protein